MKTIIFIIAALLTAQLTYSQSKADKLNIPSKTTTQVVSYTCPMHPDVVLNHSGTCSKCGTKLVIDRRGSKQSSIIYKCSMHPDVISSKPGKCPKCGMALVAEKSKNKTKKS